MNDKIVFGQYYNASSLIHRLDPRTKLIFVFALMISMFIVNSIQMLAVFLLLTIVIIALSKVPLGKFLSSVKMMSFVILFTFVFQLLFQRKGEIIATLSFTLTVTNLLVGLALLVVYFLSKKIIKKFRMILFLLIAASIMYLQYAYTTGYQITSYVINIYDEGLEYTIFVVGRIVLLLLISSILTLTTKPTDLNNGLESLLKPLKIFKLNVGVFSMMISIALRYIPTLINETEKILKAQASRGVDFKEGNLKQKISQIISLIVPMFVVAYNRADDLANAMEARGYNPDGERTSINVLKYKASDILALTFTALLFASTIVLRVCYAL